MDLLRHACFEQKSAKSRAVRYPFIQGMPIRKDVLIGAANAHITLLADLLAEPF